MKKPSQQGPQRRCLPQEGTLHRASSIAERSLLQRDYTKMALSHNVLYLYVLPIKRPPQKGPLFAQECTNKGSKCSSNKGPL